MFREQLCWVLSNPFSSVWLLSSTCFMSDFQRQKQFGVQTRTSSFICVLSLPSGCTLESRPTFSFFPRLFSELMLMPSHGPKQRCCYGDLISPTTVIHEPCSPSPWGQRLWPHEKKKKHSNINTHSSSSQSSCLPRQEKVYRFAFLWIPSA